MSLYIAKWVKITNGSVIVNGVAKSYNSREREMIVELYRECCNDYPKFFKMDGLCRLGFVALELLLNDEQERFVEGDERPVIMFNKAGSIYSDAAYQKTIGEGDAFFPSPAVFVYTLPNIVTGEICIRNRYYGESSFYVLDSWNEKEIFNITSQTLADGTAKSALCGWLESYSDDEFEALIFLVVKGNDNAAGVEFNEENLMNYKHNK